MARFLALLNVLATLLAVALADSSGWDLLQVSTSAGCILVSGAPACSQRNSVTIKTPTGDPFLLFIGAKFFGNPSIQSDRPGCFDLLTVPNNGQVWQTVTLDRANCLLQPNGAPLNPPQCCNSTYIGDDNMINPYWYEYQKTS